jgi:integrase
MALYKQKNSSTWFYDFTVDGRRYRGTTKTSNKTQALAMEADLRNKAREKGPNFIPRRIAMNLQELSERFLGWVKTAQIEPKTRIYYEYGWKTLSRSALSKIQVAVITSDIVEAVGFTKSDGKPASPKYSNQAICTLKRMLSKAKEWHLIAEVPAIKPRKAYGRDRLITQEDEDKLIATASQPLRDVLIIAMDTGMRPNEIFRIRSEDILWSEMEIFIPKSKTDAGRRKVPISERMQAILLKRSTGKPGWIFPSKTGKGHLKSVAVAFRGARSRAELDERLVLYSARHTFGTFALQATGNLPAVMQTMGHASVSSTLPYQHHGTKLIRGAIDKRNSTS